MSHSAQQIVRLSIPRPASGLLKLASCAVLSLTLAACGGGGGGTTATSTSISSSSSPSNTAPANTTPSSTPLLTPAPSNTATSNVNGTVAYGRPVIGAALVAIDVNGNKCGSATTASNGTYSMSTTCAAGPVEFAVTSNTPNNIPLMTLALSSDGNSPISGTVNITPLTTMIVYDFIGTQTLLTSLQSPSSPSQIITNIPLLEATMYRLNGNSAGFAAISAAYQSAANRVLTALAQSLSSFGVSTTSGFNPVTTPFSPNGQGVDAFFDAYPATVTGSNNLQLGTGSNPILTITFSGSPNSPATLGGSSIANPVTTTTSQNAPTTGTGSAPSGSTPTAARPEYVYVTNSPAHTISQYTVGSGGMLSPMAVPTIATALDALSLTVDPTSRYVYVTGSTNSGGVIYQYTIGTAGVLAPMTPQSVATSVLTNDSAASVVVDPTGRYAYVANQFNNTLSQFTIGPGGALSPMSPLSVPTGPTPYSVIVDSTGKYVYVANSASNTISQYTIGTSGALVPMTPSSVATGAGPRCITVDPTGRYVYVANSASNTISQYTIGSNGTLIPMAPSSVATGGTSPTSVTTDPSGQYAYVTNQMDNTVSQYTIGSGGALSPMSPSSVATGNLPESITVDPTGCYAYVTNENNNGASQNTVSQYTIGPSGALSPMTPSSVAAGIGPRAIAVARP